MVETLRSVPMIGQAAPDLVVQAQDWPDADKLAARLRRALPPQLLGKDAEQDGQQQGQHAPQIPPELMQKVQELQQENERLKQESALEVRKIELDRYKIDQDNLTKIEVAKINANQSIASDFIAQQGEIARSAAQSAAEGAQSPQAGQDGGQEIAPQSEAE